jgi:anti-sigma-K factor RskA
MEAGIHELTAAYALDALEPDERRAYEDHLAGCAPCQEELASFGEVTGALAVAASGPAPRPELRERVLAAAPAERQVVVPFERKSRRTAPVLAGLAAVAAVVAIALGLWATLLSSDLDEARSALDVLADPDARTVSLQTGSGRLVVDPDGRAVLVLDGLDEAPSGKTYEVWVIEDGSASPAGLFSATKKGDPVDVEGTVDEGDVVAVTVEKAGGVTEPSTEPIVASEPV